MKEHFNKGLVKTKEDDENLNPLQNVGFVIILLLKMMVKYKIIVMSLENIGVLHTEIVISTSA